jgi:aldose sugar dehydrogenase
MQSKVFSYLLVITVLFFSTGCGNDSSSPTEDKKIIIPNSRAHKTNKANTDYKPAFEGQTRADSVLTTTAYKVDKLAEKIGRPWAIITLPDGRLLIKLALCKYLTVVVH